MSVRSLRRGAIAASRAAAVGTPTTYTLFGVTTDGWVAAPVQFATGVGTTVDTSSTENYFGVAGADGYETFIAFDTSSVDDAATITAVTLSLYGVSDSTPTDFTIEVRIHDWGATLTTADWVSQADLGSKTLVASKSTAGWNLSGYNVFTSQAAFLANINKTGVTRLIVNSSRHRLNEAGDNYASCWSGRASGTSQDPKLVIEALV